MTLGVMVVEMTFECFILSVYMYIYNVLYIQYTLYIGHWHFPRLARRLQLQAVTLASTPLGILGCREIRGRGDYFAAGETRTQKYRAFINPLVQRLDCCRFEKISSEGKCCFWIMERDP